MDIIGAINHQFQQAGVRVRSRIVGDVVEVQVMVPTRPRGTIYYGRMTLDEFVRQFGIEVVGGKLGSKIKKAAKAVVKNDLVRKVVKNASQLAASMVPGGGLALKGAATLATKATQLAKQAKKGDEKARKLLKAPLVVRPLPPGKTAQGPVIASRSPLRAASLPRPTAAPAPRALPAYAQDREEDLQSEEQRSYDDEPVESGEVIEAEHEPSADEQQTDDEYTERLISSEDPEEVAGAGDYYVTTPAGLRVKVQLP